MLLKLTVTVATGLVFAATAAAAPAMSDWTMAQKISDVAGNSSELNSSSADGCPILSPDGRSLFMASNRPHPDAHGGLDIWVATRAGTDEPFGAPQVLPEPINSNFNDFCPTPLRGNRLLFVSNRNPQENCGMGDIYITRHNPARGWREPRRLPCAPEGPNTSLDEQGPSYLDLGDGEAQLFFSSSAPGVSGDIFVSQKPDGGEFGPGMRVAELSSPPPDNDIQPNVRKDGLEVVFSSNRPHPDAQGGQDIYSATRASVDDPWSAPVNLGGAVNTDAAESRPSLSWDARTLLFGRAPGGPMSGDIWISTR